MKQLTIESGSDDLPTFVLQRGQESTSGVEAEISLLRERYSDQELISNTFAAFNSTRRNGSVSRTVLLAQLIRWREFPTVQVEEGLRVYLEKDCAAQGKDEKYLLGIIRNVKVEKKIESTGSVLLDLYYAGNRR